MKRSRTLFYRFVVLGLVIFVVWVISPLTSGDSFKWTSFEFWLRIIVTIWIGGWLIGLIDTRGSLAKWKSHEPPICPRSIAAILTIVIPAIFTIPIAFYNLILVILLFPNILLPQFPIIVGIISIIASASVMGFYGIVYYRIYIEWREEPVGGQFNVTARR